MMRILTFQRWFVAAGVLVALSATAGRAADWGTIKGKFVYKGDAKAAVITPTKDVEVCGQHELADETIAVGDGGGLRDVFVYLYVARGKKIQIHPDFKPGELKSLANKGCRFEPHALTLWTADELEVRNDDSIGHNTNLNFAVNADFNQLVVKESPLKKKFDRTEPAPSPVTCNIHPWMRGNVLVRDNPYMAASAADGTFEIANVPAGAQELILWHESHGYLRDLAVGKEKADRKGQIKVKVPAGDVIDLGVIEVTPGILGK